MTGSLVPVSSFTRGVRKIVPPIRIRAASIDSVVIMCLYSWVDRLDGSAALDPVFEAPEIVDVVVAHLFEQFTAQRRAFASRAVENDSLVLVKTFVVIGRLWVGSKLQLATGDVHSAGDLATPYEFRRLAHIDD